MNIIKWFRCRYTVCTECGVHFEPPIGITNTKHASLCLPHRIPAMEEDLRKEKVMAWAERHWQELEPQYLQEFNRIHEEVLRAFMPACGTSQQAASFYGQGNPLGNLFSWDKPQ